MIRYNLAWPFTTFALSAGMLAMGLVFLGFGILFLRLTPATEQKARDAEEEEGVALARVRITRDPGPSQGRS